MVTGAGGGIGQAVAVGLGAEGWDLALVGRSPDSLTATRDRLTGRAVVLAADVRDPAGIANAVAEAEHRLGPLDALVNNAGVQRLSPALEVTEGDWDDVLDTNLKGAFFCAQAAGRAMVSRGRGVIVNVASAAALIAVADRAAYAASKAGLVMLTRVLALEWAKHNIRVNAIIPGVSFTAQPLENTTPEELLERGRKTIPLGRVGYPDDVAGLAAYLVSADAAYMTGQGVAINGGRQMVP